MASKALELLSPKLRSVMREFGYKELLPVQELAIPIVLSGSHTLIIAPTGSGKTEAALFPVVTMMLGDDCSGVKAVYITPLRALNRDVESRIKKIIELSGLRVMVKHGDTTVSKRREFSSSPPDLAITTPESLGLMLSSRNAGRIWGCVRWVIVDEIHELLDSERGSELSLVLERLSRIARRRIQRIALSATISEKSEAEAKKLLAGRRLVATVRDPSPKTYDIRVECVGSEDYWVKVSERIAEIIRGVRGKVLVFVNTRGTAELLASTLSKLLGDETVAVHHGSLSRQVREGAEQEFKTGRKRVLVATSSMELGIDIGDIDLVIQFLSPRSVITMSQRAGRAGHRFGETSKAIIVTSDNLFELIESNVIAGRVVRGDLEHIRIHRNPLDALAHQVVGEVVARRRLSLQSMYDLVSSAGPFLELDYSLFEDVVYHLDQVRLARLEDDGEHIRISSRSMKYFYKVSMIPDERNYTVYDVVSGTRVGELSERFIEASLMREGEGEGRFHFVLAGKVWEALDIDFESGRVEAKPIGVASAAVPSWEGELIPVDYRVSREGCGLITLCMEGDELCEILLAKKGASKQQIEKIKSVLEQTRREWGGIVLSMQEPVIEAWRGSAILYACLGSKGNFALALLISRILERRGIHVIFDYIPYAIVFQSPSGVDPQLIASAIMEAKNMDAPTRRILVRDSVRSSIAYMIRFLQVAKRLGVVDPDKTLSRELVSRLVKAYEGSIVETETLREISYDKLDFEALDSFLNEVTNVHIVTPEKPSALLKEVASNPYLRKDKAVDLRTIALSTLIESFKKRVKEKSVLLLCASCGHSWRARVLDIQRGVECPKCGSRMIAILPDTEWGRSVVDVFKKYKSSRKRPRGKNAKLVKEVYSRANLFLEYYREGLSGKVAEALMAPGVGPNTAIRVLNAYIERGEKGFYSELFRAIENYASTKRYWSTKREREKTKRG